MTQSNTCPTCQQRLTSPQQQRLWTVVGISLGLIGAAVGIYASLYGGSLA